MEKILKHIGASLSIIITFNFIMSFFWYHQLFDNKYGFTPKLSLNDYYFSLIELNVFIIAPVLFALIIIPVIFVVFGDKKLENLDVKILKDIKQFNQTFKLKKYSEKKRRTDLLLKFTIGLFSISIITILSYTFLSSWYSFYIFFIALFMPLLYIVLASRRPYIFILWLLFIFLWGKFAVTTIINESADGNRKYNTHLIFTYNDEIIDTKKEKLQFIYGGYDQFFFIDSINNKHVTFNTKDMGKIEYIHERSTFYRKAY